jgi:hypothetical protein
MFGRRIRRPKENAVTTGVSKGTVAGNDRGAPIVRRVRPRRQMLINMDDGMFINMGEEIFPFIPILWV